MLRDDYRSEHWNWVVHWSFKSVDEFRTFIFNYRILILGMFRGMVVDAICGRMAGFFLSQEAFCIILKDGLTLLWVLLVL